MAQKKVEQVKKGGWFKPLDIIIYAVFAAVIITLIIVFSLTRDKSAMQGVNITYKGESVLTYNFGDSDPVVLKDGYIEVKSNTQSGITLIFRPDGGGYNEIYIDKGAKSARVVASDCSTHKDCVYTPALTSNGSTPIFCHPHALCISPTNFYDNGNIK